MLRYHTEGRGKGTWCNIATHRSKKRVHSEMNFFSSLVVLWCEDLQQDIPFLHPFNVVLLLHTSNCHPNTYFGESGNGFEHGILGENFVESFRHPKTSNGILRLCIHSQDKLIWQSNLSFATINKLEISKSFTEKLHSRSTNNIANMNKANIYNLKM